MKRFIRVTNITLKKRNWAKLFEEAKIVKILLFKILIARNVLFKVQFVEYTTVHSCRHREIPQTLTFESVKSILTRAKKKLEPAVPEKINLLIDFLQDDRSLNNFFKATTLTEEGKYSIVFSDKVLLTALAAATQIFVGCTHLVKNQCYNRLFKKFNKSIYTISAGYKVLPTVPPLTTLLTLHIQERNEVSFFMQLIYYFLFIVLPYVTWLLLYPPFTPLPFPSLTPFQSVARSHFFSNALLYQETRLSRREVKKNRETYSKMPEVKCSFHDIILSTRWMYRNN